MQYRLIVDDTFGIGVLGKTGRGSVEESGLAFADVEAVCGVLDGTFGSVGGFCVGAHKIIDHQRHIYDLLADPCAEVKNNICIIPGFNQLVESYQELY